MHSIPKNPVARKPDEAGEELPRATIWMPIFLKDHRATASTLDHTEHSVFVYFRLLLWEGGGAIPDDDKWIAKHVRVSLAKWKALKPVISEGCEIHEGLIFAPDVAAEYEKAQNNIKQKSIAGIKSGESRRRAKAERLLNGCSNGSLTAVEPRAGVGVGEGAGGGYGAKGRTSPDLASEEEPFA